MAGRAAPFTANSVWPARRHRCRLVHSGNGGIPLRWQWLRLERRLQQQLQAAEPEHHEGQCPHQGEPAQRQGAAPVDRPVISIVVRRKALRRTGKSGAINHRGGANGGSLALHRVNSMTPSSTPAAAPRRILLTGASSGIGYQAAVQLCRAGHRLTLPCRDAATAADLLSRLDQAAVAGAAPQAPICDLADLASVERCAAELLRQGEPIDSLVLNAGLQYSGSPEPRRSAQGHELTIAVNHLAHQALAQRLIPLLDGGRDPRLVITASEVHDPAAAGGRVGKPAGLGDLAGLRAGLRPENGHAMVSGCLPFDADKAYKDSKLCNLLFARELERRLRGRGTPLPVLAWSPGLVIPPSSGGFFRYSRRHNEWGQRLFALVARDLLRITATAEQAGRLLAELSTAGQHGSAGCRYWSNRVVGPGRLRLELAEPSAEALTDSLAHELWALSAERVGLAAELPSPPAGASPWADLHS